MKTFLEYSSVKATDGEHIDDDGHLMDLSDDSVVEKLNAFVGSIGMKEYLVPEKAVNELRQKLMRIGLHFEDVNVIVLNPRFLFFEHLLHSQIF